MQLLFTRDYFHLRYGSTQCIIYSYACTQQCIEPITDVGNPDTYITEFSTFTSFKACEPLGITTIRDLDNRRVIIGTKGNKNYYLQIRWFDSKHSETMKFDEGIPERLASNKSTSDIAVIAANDSTERTVVVLSRFMKQKFKYPQKSSNCVPTDVAFDIWNYLVICDAKSNSILLVNQEGVLQSEIPHSFDVNISAIGCLPSGHAWMGRSGNITTMQYKHVSGKYEIHKMTLH